MFKHTISMLVTSATDFSNHQGMANSAAIAYFAAFSLPSMLLILIALVGFFVEPQDVRVAIDHRVKQVAGAQAANQVNQILTTAAQEKPQRNGVATIIGGILLLFGATGVLVQLQISLNQIWQVDSQPNQSAWAAFVLKRLLSLSMLLVFAFLLLLTISVQAVISEVGPRLETILPHALSSEMLMILNQFVGFCCVCLLLAAMFRFLPDATIAWKSVWFGAIVTTVLFMIGQQAMGYYLSQSNPGKLYGAAGSLAVVLMWVYYAAIIFLFGAQLTKTWADRTKESTATLFDRH